ncbi:hypothetical protein VTL71DRAFT_5272 [Oculimacula yallundae]|uniref:Polyketide synthase n=1 Tax=Oculimacula yallundae TaxID=86028 RepID=A0ABR4C1M9_9HELO
MATEEIPIAVIGMSYRAPGAGRTDLWEYLSQARNAWTEVPKDRFDHTAYFRPGAERPGVSRVSGAHFLDGGIYEFDAAFFNMRAEEARNVDPQHRLLLECALEASEDAGKTLLDLAGQNIGVFIGSALHEYSYRIGEDEFSTTTFSGTGIAPCMAANRVSYFFDINGPSATYDTACASGLYAAHGAVSALRNNECRAAFIAAASLNIGPGGWMVLDKTGALSASGRSYSYDEKAAGFGRGEGAGCLLIKRLDDAIRDGDPIHALLRNTATNHAGRSDGITMPNGVAQRELIRAVHNGVGLDPSDTPVVEGHGTGTPAGDPIEAGAFAAVLAGNRTADNPIHIGSLKSNFGHLEGASGALALVKAVMMVEKGIFLPTAGFEKINHRIVDGEKIRVAQVPIPWPQGEKRRALITNFGLGGSNAACIVEAFEPGTNRTNGTHSTHGTNGVNGNSISDNQKLRLYAFSAAAEKGLLNYLSHFGNYLHKVDNTGHLQRDLSYTLGQRRTHHPYRVAIVAKDIEDLQEKLLKAKPNRVRYQNVIFAFTGQGAQHAQMGAGLTEFKVFAKAIDDGDEHLRSLGATWSLKSELAKPAEESRINVAEISQPACTAIQLALVMLLQSWGVSATAVVGHSSGEIAAAFTAGLVSFKTALTIAYFRGQAAARLNSTQFKKGAMLALGIGPEEAAKLVQEHAGGDYATVAAINSPSSVTVSGDAIVVERIHKIASAQGVFARKLKIEVAYHSRHMEAEAESYFSAIKPSCDEDASAKDSSSPVFVSSVTGRVEETIDAAYWIKNLVQPVKFADAVKTLFTTRDMDNIKSSRETELPNIVIEIGPHGALKGPITQTVEHYQLSDKNFVYLPSLMRGIASEEAMTTLASSLFTKGAQIDLGGVNQTNKHNSRVLSGLPPYSWDKSVSYEVRPRATNEKLFPGEEYHDLLGRRAVAHGGQERVYRQVFTLDDQSWIRDHMVAGVCIFPMTGYMSCAIEACKRTLSVPAQAFVVQNFHVTRSLEVKEDERIELVTKLRPAPLGEGGFSSTVWSFEISSFTTANGWTRHAYGEVEAEMVPMTMDTPTFTASLPLADTANLLEHDIEVLYTNAGIRATRYGPSFRNVVKFHEGKGFTILEQRVRDMSHTRPDTRGSVVSVDPQTLDGFLQGGFPLQVDENGKTPAQMPTHINRFRISNKIPLTPNTKFDVVMRLLTYDGKAGRMEVGVAAFLRNADGTRSAIAEYENVSFRSIGSAEENIDPAADVPDHWAWEFLQRYDFVSQAELLKKITVEPLGAPVAEHERQLDAAAAYYMKKALVEMEGEDFSKLPFHLARFTNWAKKIVKSYQSEIPAHPASLLEEVSTYNAQGELLCRIGERIPAILRGEVQPLEIMLEGGLLSRHYEADVKNAYLSHALGDLLDNLATMSPNLRILEIGGGTAGTTLPVLEGLSRNRDEPGFLSYTFTDISSGFFENARDKLSRWSDRVIYKKCDITQNPLEQGFYAQEFDVVIAADVLHATPDMVQTMNHVRTMLKPGGKLFLREATAHVPAGLTFAVLPGWWGAKDKYRDQEEGPVMGVETWNCLLLDVGFSGIDASVTARQDSPNAMNLMCSHRVALGTQASQAITICGQFLDDGEVEYAETLAKYLSEQMNCPVDARPYNKIDTAEDSLYIFIDSKEQSVLRDPSESRFKDVQTLLVKNKGILWIIPAGAAPDAFIIKGMLRTIRLEQDTKRTMMLDAIPTIPSSNPAILKLAKLLRDNEVTRSEDQDFQWQDGFLTLPRMRQVREVKEQFAVDKGVSYRTTQNLWTGGALEMTIDAAGSADSIYFRRTAALRQELAEDEVLLQVEAAGVSSRDLDLVMGIMPWAPPGFDGAGTVVKTGSKVSHIQAGDKVFFLALEESAFASYKKVSVNHVGLIPKGMTTTSAASIPLAYSLAVLALIEIARLKKNETVLIHSAAGALGQACIVLAKHIGARVYATAGTEAKRELLHKMFGIPKDQIFSNRTNAFRDSVLSATNGKGVDVIVNSLSGELLTATWALISAFGRFVEVGKKDALQNNSLNMKPFDNNATFSAIDIRALYHHRPDEIRNIFSQVVSLLDKKIVAPIEPMTVLPISDFSSALRKIKSGDIAGKVVVTLGKDEKVVAESALLPCSATLKADATYLVTGGTGGIGLDLAAWMIENGAKNIVLLGRSGGDSPSVQKLQQKYKGTDVTIRALKCNVGVRNEMVHSIGALSDLPPIRGVIHSALLLSDKIFENATYEDWDIVTVPRVKGAWNLHELMPKNLDFMVLLSSFNGRVGNMGQAVYAGTCVFYDEFARMRNTQGQHTVSIALPVVLDVGWAVKNNLSDILKEPFALNITMADIRCMVRSAIAGPESPFHTDGVKTAFRLRVDGVPTSMKGGQWDHFHFIQAKEHLQEEKLMRQKAGTGTTSSTASWTAAEDPLTGLIEALITKVSGMTMISRDEVLADLPLVEYSLDSLVSVELRNWIRRETNVELALGVITRSKSLRDLATKILAQVGGAAK